MSEIEQLRKERDEAREWVSRLQRESQTLTCVYCGAEYPPGLPTHGSEVLTEHIRVCEKHPMRALEQKCEKLRSALVGIVGVETKEDLEQLEAVTRVMPAPADDKVAMLNAIRALIETT